MQRIAVIGISGSGKTTFARALARATGLPLRHVDQLFWTGRWRPVPEHAYLECHSAWVSRDRWIIEGFVDPSFAQRLRRADLVVYLTPPPWVCAGRGLKRWWAHRKTARAELPAEALERLDFGFLWVVLSAAERPAIAAALARSPEAVVRRLAGKRDQAALLRELEDERTQKRPPGG